jgi:hypothetical protein
MLRLSLRASTASPVFLGDDGLTAKQNETLDELMSKIKLTEKQAEKRDELIAKRDSPVELSAGAKTLIEEYVDRKVYRYENNFSNPTTEKGWAVEVDSIEVYNDVFDTKYKKLKETDKYYSIEYGILVGHPDIVDCERRKVIDIKSSWTKKTFPKTPEKAYDVGYQWQVKLYLYMLSKITGDDWRYGEVAHVLVSTPETIKPEWESESLHYVDDFIDERLCVTTVPVELTDDDILKIERRVKAAEAYANEYYKQVINKNK